MLNNAGVMKLARFVEADDTTFDELVAINLKDVFNGLREAARRLRDGGGIVNFSSSVVGLYLPTYGIYAAHQGRRRSHDEHPRRGMRTLLADLIRKGQAAQQIDPGLDAEPVASMLISVIDGSKTLQVRDPKLDIGKIADLLKIMIACFLTLPAARRAE